MYQVELVKVFLSIIFLFLLYYQIRFKEEECNSLALTIITAGKIFCKTEDQIVYFTTLQ